jgi:hypothetical protein
MQDYAGSSSPPVADIGYDQALYDPAQQLIAVKIQVIPFPFPHPHQIHKQTMSSINFWCPSRPVCLIHEKVLAPLINFPQVFLLVLHAYLQCHDRHPHVSASSCSFACNGPRRMARKSGRPLATSSLLLLPRGQEE